MSEVRLTGRPSETYACMTCGEMFETAQARGNHSRAHQEIETCAICGRAFRYLDAHLRRQHPDFRGELHAALSALGAALERVNLIAETGVQAYETLMAREDVPEHAMVGLSRSDIRTAFGRS